MKYQTVWAEEWGGHTERVNEFLYIHSLTRHVLNIYREPGFKVSLSVALLYNVVNEMK